MYSIALILIFGLTTIMAVSAAPTISPTGEIAQSVRHCFLYHRSDDDIHQCNGISFNRPPFPTDHLPLGILWNKLVDEYTTLSKKAIAVGDLDQAVVNNCLYQTEPSHIYPNYPEDLCQRIASRRNDLPFKDSHKNAVYLQHLRVLRKRYWQQKREDKVQDCVLHHREDNLPECEDISWSKNFNPAIKGDKMTTPRNARYQEAYFKLWSAGKLEPKCKTKRC